MKFTRVESHYPLTHSAIPRSGGVHVSDLYNSLYRTLQPNRYAKKGALVDSPFDPGIMALGLAWEAHFEKVLKAAGVDAERPGEFTTKEGVTFSPDLLINNGGTRGGEIKLTRYAIAPITDDRFAKWRTQMMAYGHHLQIADWTLYAFHILGTNNYNDPLELRNPTLVETHIEFTKAEMAEEWGILVRHGQQLKLL